jgi:hypothetical protein
MDSRGSAPFFSLWWGAHVHFVFRALFIVVVRHWKICVVASRLVWWGWYGWLECFEFGVAAVRRRGECVGYAFDGSEAVLADLANV